MTLGDYYEAELKKAKAECLASKAESLNLKAENKKLKAKIEKIHENRIINQIRTLKYLNQDSKQIIKYLEDNSGLTLEEAKDALDKFEKLSS